MDSNKITVCYAYMDVSDPSHISATELRGFLGYFFVEDTEFHHHSENPYHYPLVQYKKVNGRLVVLGLNDYAEMVSRKIASLDHISIPDGKIPVSSVEIVTRSFEVQEEENKYRFISPWIALSEDNFSKFKDSVSEKRKDLLSKILVGNILSMLKGLGIFLKFKVTIKIGNYRQLTTTVHGNQFLTFKTPFMANVRLPEYLGLGKSVSKGFGAIETL